MTDDTHGTPRARHRVVTRRCYYCGATVRVMVEHGVTPDWSMVRVTCVGCKRGGDDDTTTEDRP